MNNDAEYLMHMTTAEKAAYNRKYYQRNKQYWVDYYKTGHGIGRNGGNSHTVGRSAGGEYHYGNENTLNDLYKDFPMGSKKNAEQPKKKKELLQNPVTQIRRANNVVKINDELFEKKKEPGASRRPVNQNDARRTGSSSGIHPAVLDQFDRVLRNQTLRKQLGENAESSARRWVSNEQNERNAATARAMDDARERELSKLYNRGVNRTRSVNVPTKTESGSAMNPPVYKGKQGHWNENAERVTSAARSFLSNLKNTITNAAKGTTQTIARSAENGRKYASSMFSSVKATVGDIKREANDLISRAKKTLDEVMSGEIQLQGKSGTRHNMVTGKAFYYDTLKGIVQPISELEAMELSLNNKQPKEWSFHDFQEEKIRRRRP